MAFSFDDMDAAVRGVFGDAATLTPQAREQYTAGAGDPARPAQTIYGVFSAGPSHDGVSGRGEGQRPGGTTLASEGFEFWMAAADVATIPYQVRRGDKLAVGAITYIIAAVHSTDAGDANLILTREA